MANGSRIRTISFPFRLGAQSFPEGATDIDAIKASVIQIITTAKGERIMRPGFGCSAFDFVFESFNEDLQLTVEREVRQSLATWETRIRVDAVQVSTDDIVEPGQMLILVQYTVLLTGEPDAVVVAGGQ